MSLISLDTVKGIGPKTVSKFKSYNIKTTYDLVMFLPRKYELFEPVELNFNNHNEIITVFAQVVSLVTLNRFGKVPSVSFNILTNNKVIKAIAFNQVFLEKSLRENEEVYIKGKYDYSRNQIVVSKVIKEGNFTNFKPKYNLNDISDSLVTKSISYIFSNNLVTIYNLLPFYIINKYHLLNRYDALKAVHLASNTKEYYDGINYMKHEEAYLFQKELNKNINVPIKRDKISYDLSLIKEFIDSIGFELTPDQKEAVNDIFRDFKGNEVSYRLIQGDVGSGKTIVAIIGILGMLSANKQVALMAPTELLAEQHYQNIIKYFDKLNYEVALLTSDTKDKESIKDRLANGKINLIIGTHALVQDDVVFNDLGLSIIDEQHKFGVNTRNNLIKKSNSSDLIYLTATPIPRTLAISIFKDAKISLIKSKPNERKVIETKYINDDDLTSVYKLINEVVSKHEKVYVVVPAVTSIHAKYNIENVYKLLNDNIKTNNIYQLYGKTKKSVQKKVFDNFKNDDGAVLIATTMIEVGIDIKDATLMVIFSADYFGLSQLHQLRGRVGRSKLKSKCILVSTKDNQERLKILEKVNDGFILSQYDLKLRGPGLLLGLEQSGVPEFKYLDFSTDFEILKAMGYEAKNK